MSIRGKKLRDIDYTIKDLEEEIGETKKITKKTLRTKILSICEEAGIEQHKIRSNESEMGDYILLFEWYQLLKLLIESDNENPFGRRNASKAKRIEDIELYYEKIFSSIDKLPKYIKYELEGVKYYQDNKKLPEIMKELISKITELISAIFLIASDEQVEFMEYISKSIDGWISNLYTNRRALNLALKDYASHSDCSYTELKFYSVRDLLLETFKLLVDDYNYNTIESKLEWYRYILDDMLSDKCSIEDKRFFFMNKLEEKYENDDEWKEEINEIVVQLKKEKRDKDFISIKEEMVINTKREVENLKKKLELLEKSNSVDELVEITRLQYDAHGKGFNKFKELVRSNTYKYEDDVNKFIASIITNNYIK